jgi:rubrerythrin
MAEQKSQLELALHKEQLAIRTIIKRMETVDEPTQRRIVRYLADRYDNDTKAVAESDF